MPLPSASHQLRDCHRLVIQSHGRTSPVSDLFPVVCAVALLTAIAELGVVDVIRRMASKAVASNSRGILPLGCRMLVAALACHAPVRPIQAVGSAAVVIKGPDGPGSGVVAVVTPLPKTFLVLVLLLVTGEAVARSVLIAGTCVALLAGRGGVASRQRKA